MNPHKLGTESGYYYISLGHGTFTLVGRENRYTYRLSQKTNENGSKSPIFVSLLTGPQNTHDYHYLGFIPTRRRDESNPRGYSNLELKASRRENAENRAFKALAWWIHMAAKRAPIANEVEFWHEGTCGKCGRKLTVPESIATGIGPVCAEKT